MKKNLFVLFVLASQIVFAKNITDSIFVLDKIPAEGLYLNKGWKIHPGDDLRWADPLYRDSGWSFVNPQTGPSYKSYKTGWLRLKIKVGENLRGKQAALLIDHSGAAEIYFNGSLVQKYGVVSGDANLEQTYIPHNRFIVLQLTNEPEQFMAVRYSNHIPDLFKLRMQSGMALQLNDIDTAWKNEQSAFGILINFSLLFGIFMIMAILHFLLYLGYRSKKVNLYFALYAFFQGCTFQVFSPTLMNSATADFIGNIIFTISAPLASIFYLKAIYSLFKVQTGWWFYFIITCCIAALILQWYPEYIVISIALFGSGILVISEIIRVSIIAIRKKMPGAKPFLIGQVLSLVCFVSMGVLATLNTQVSSRLMITLGYILLDGAFLISPILLSNILARDFSATNTSLREQLEQVKKLSAENVAQEQERQRILASQNERLEVQVAERTSELQNSLQKLQTTQSQLIQSEKMASLGELTAGIAHEIQNPLNFVNNFSEVSHELVGEMNSELAKGNLEEAKLIGSDIQQNLEKINHHGKRADAIVKGMLQHTRSSSGTKEPTDINALAEEYLRLSYHGLRAKDKSFNADIKTDFDADVENINIISQDIGRVLLNLYNNAFYSVNEKKKLQGEIFQPMVEVFTKKSGDNIEIRIRDNGAGIPQKVLDKIYQPFFTTKPAGQGTGLGLSMSYDIIKAHGGELNAKTKEGDFAEFVIILPTDK